MRLIIGTVLVLILTVASSLADPAGTYRVSGTNPGNGSTYSGTVTVKRNGDTFLLAWTIAGSRQIGVGIGKDDFLAVSYRSGDSMASLSIGRMRIVVGRAFGRHSAAKPSELRSELEAPKDFLDWTARRRQLTNPDVSRRPSPSTRRPQAGSAVLRQAGYPRRGTAGLRRTSPVFRHWSIASLPHSAPHICGGLRKSGMAQCGLATIIESWLSSV